MWLLRTIVLFLRTLLRDRAELAMENLALRQQLAILEQTAKRPQLGNRDRIFWVWLSRLWAGWRTASSSFNPTRLCAGIGKDSSSTGDGSPDERPGGRRSTLRFGG